MSPIGSSCDRRRPPRVVEDRANFRSAADDLPSSAVCGRKKVAGPGGPATGRTGREKRGSGRGSPGGTNPSSQLEAIFSRSTPSCRGLELYRKHAANRRKVSRNNLPRSGSVCSWKRRRSRSFPPPVDFRDSPRECGEGGHRAVIFLGYPGPLFGARVAKSAPGVLGARVRTDSCDRSRR